jgi:hypothetical protein
VSGFRVAIPISRDIPRPSRSAIIERPSGCDDAEVCGLAEVGRRTGVAVGTDIGLFGIVDDRWKVRKPRGKAHDHSLYMRGRFAKDRTRRYLQSSLNRTDAYTTYRLGYKKLGEICGLTLITKLAINACRRTALFERLRHHSPSGFRPRVDSDTTEGTSPSGSYLCTSPFLYRSSSCRCHLAPSAYRKS